MAHNAHRKAGCRLRVAKMRLRPPGSIVNSKWMNVHFECRSCGYVANYAFDSSSIHFSTDKAVVATWKVAALHAATCNCKHFECYLRKWAARSRDRGKMVSGVIAQLSS